MKNEGVRLAMAGQWSIMRWAAWVFVVATVASLLAVGFLVHWQEGNIVERFANEQAARASRQLVDDICAEIRRGSVEDHVSALAERFAQTNTGSTVSFIRGPAVVNAYGDRPETGDPEAADPAVQWVLQSGQPQLLSDGNGHRFLHPITQQDACVSCHPGAAEGAVNGVIDIRLDSERLLAPFRSVIQTAFLGLAVVLSLTFLTVFLMLRAHVVKPIRDLAATMSAIRQSPGLVRRIRPRRTRTLELTLLTETFNSLMTEVNTHRISLVARGEALVTARDQAERALVQANAASRAKSRFLASMSHELRTPLNAILGFSEILRDQLLGPLGTPQYREYARHVHDSGVDLRTLIDDMMDLAQIETGEDSPHPAALNLGEHCAALGRLYRERLAVKTLNLVQDIPATLPPVQADPNALRQILDNLLSNAIKYTPSGGTIRMSANTRSDGGVTFSITDTGIGIDRDLQDLIFSPYGPVANLDTRTTEGTGLGMALVKARMEQCGGSITLTSRPGEGATFTLRFPPAPGTAPPTAGLAPDDGPAAKTDRAVARQETD